MNQIGQKIAHSLQTISNFYRSTSTAVFKKNSIKIGHAVILTDASGREIAHQFHIPHDTENTNPAPSVRRLLNIERITPYGLTRYRAESPNGTRMYASRFIDIEHKKDNSSAIEKMRIATFPPPPRGKKEPFWGSVKSPTMFRTDMQEDDQKEFEQELEEIPARYKGGRELIVEPTSVRERSLIKTRTPDQNTVMGESAKDCYAGFMESLANELHPDMLEIFYRAINAPLNGSLESNYRPEWLHLEGFSLTPTSIDPQRKDNLAAGPKWANTEMMVLERIAKWYALNQPDTFIKILPHFEMLMDSDIVKKIKFEVTLEEKNKTVRMFQEINPFLKYPLFRKATDLAQATAIVNSILRGNTAEIRQDIPETEQAGPPRIMSQPGVTMETAIIKNSINKEHSDMQQNILSTEKVKSEPLSFPTQSIYEKSVVQVLTTYNTPDYNSPWKGVDTGTCTGTGIIIEHDQKIYILTNAHCVENSVLVRIRLANDRQKKFESQRVCVSYQCDLALLEVTDPKFKDKVESVSIGTMTSLQKEVYTVGFPMGGNEISITKGIVSRIETGEYSMSGLDMLQVQVDSAINSGNSGGPVFAADGSVVGVAFQGINRAQNVGYMIPIPIVNHFLQEAFSGKHYRGFPVLPVSFQYLENPALRKFYGMGKKHSGVRIRTVSSLSDASKKLKPDDILLAIDGHSISNEGTVDIPDTGNCINLNHLTHMKFIGDSVRVKILRKNRAGIPEIHIFSIILDNIPFENLKVSAQEHDKMPTYYIASGIVLAPLTRNYLEDGGSDLAERYLSDEGCTLESAQKKDPDDQFIVINDILDCRETQGYDDYRNSIIKEINGRKIFNMRDAIQAIEKSEKDVHCFTTTSNKKIVVKNMSTAKHASLLARYKIHFDRSEDLRPISSSALGKQEALSSSDSENEPSNPPTSILRRLRRQRNTILSDDSPVNEKKASMPSICDASSSTVQSNTPGLEHYTARVERMFQFYSQFPLVDDNDTDPDCCVEEQKLSQSISPAGSEAEESDDALSSGSRKKRKFSHAFFHHKTDVDPDENQAHKKIRPNGSAA